MEVEEKKMGLSYSKFAQAKGCSKGLIALAVKQ